MQQIQMEWDFMVYGEAIYGEDSGFPPDLGRFVSMVICMGKRAPV
jgi:hypothetical protein